MLQVVAALHRKFRRAVGLSLYYATAVPLALLTALVCKTITTIVGLYIMMCLWFADRTVRVINIKPTNKE